jgi:hypothetical protein
MIPIGLLTVPIKQYRYWPLRYGTQHSTELSYSTVQYGTQKQIRCSQWYGTVQYGTQKQISGSQWYGTVQYGTVPGTVQYGTVKNYNV